MDLRIPNDWTPRDYQLEHLLNEFPRRKKRGVAVWHRRAGKDSAALNLTACELFQKTGVYWHMLPTQRQARKVIWNGLDGEGRRLVDQAFPKELRVRSDATEMLIELKNGSIWQLCGSDNYDALVGANPVGVVFSEWSLCNPRAWDYIRPILAENGGWALFIYTPRGTNHGKDLYSMALENDAWMASLLTVEDTSRPDGSPIISREIVEQERSEGMSEEMIDQEYYCSFDSAMPGAYYATQLKKLREAGQVISIPYDPALPVHTAWDLGIGDSMVIWFAQVHGPEIRLIDYYENSGEGFAHYAKVLQDKEYIYGKHLAPHDIAVRELGSGKSRLETARALGISFEVVSNIPVDDGIEAVRSTLPMCWFDKEKCAKGLSALGSYRKEYDEKAQDFKLRPVHDWTSHGADAFRYLCVGQNLMKLRKKYKQNYVKMSIA